MGQKSGKSSFKQGADGSIVSYEINFENWDQITVTISQVKNSQGNKLELTG